MPKHFLEDMVRRKSQEIKENKEMEPKVSPVNLSLGILRASQSMEIRKMEEIGTNNIKKRPRYMLWFVAFVSVIFCLFAITFLFLKAEVVVNPKMKDVVLNENLSAEKDSNDNGIFFNLMGPISGEENKTVVATVQKDASYKATGVVCIFNTFNSSPQKLNIDTRLEGSNGKIYKTQKETTVPGMNKSDNPVCPAEVNIYAAEAGPDYNSTPLDFNILGFKGTPKYSKFKVRSKTGTEITGGFIGKVNTISDAASSLAELNSSLKSKLLDKATNLIPPGFILFKDAVFLSTEDPVIPLTADKNNNFTITEKGSLYGILFNEQSLTKKIAEDNIEKYDGSDVYILNMKDLAFSLSQKDNVSFGDVKNINFNLSGTTKIISKLDVNKFTADLLGKSKKDFNKILSQYVNIDSAVLKLNPMWAISIPDQAKNIKVIVNYPTHL